MGTGSDEPIAVYPPYKAVLPGTLIVGTRIITMKTCGDTCTH